MKKNLIALTLIAATFTSHQIAEANQSECTYEYSGSDRLWGILGKKGKFACSVKTKFRDGREVPSEISAVLYEERRLFLVGYHPDRATTINVVDSFSIASDRCISFGFRSGDSIKICQN